MPGRATHGSVDVGLQHALLLANDSPRLTMASRQQLLAASTNLAEANRYLRQPSGSRTGAAALEQVEMVIATIEVALLQLTRD